MTYVIQITRPGSTPLYLCCTDTAQEWATPIIHPDHAAALAHAIQSIWPTIDCEVIAYEEGKDDEQPTTESRPD